jgi:hypothetical protein
VRNRGCERAQGAIRDGCVARRIPHPAIRDESRLRARAARDS